MRAFIGVLRGLCVSVALFSIGCQALLPKRQAPAEGTLPEEFSLASTEVAGRNRWWEDFQSEDLNALIQEALAESLTLRQLWARLDQAGSSAVQAASQLYPEVGFEADASYRRSVTTVAGAGSPSLGSRLREAVATGVTRGLSGGLNPGDGETPTGTGSGSVSRTGGTGLSADGWPTGDSQGGGSEGPAGRVRQETKRFGLALAADYEVDLWGRIRFGYRAAELDFLASRGDLESLAITLAAQVADRWLRILEQQALQRILQDHLATNKTYLELVELRFRKNQASALDVYQQRQAVSEVERQVPLVQAQEQVLRHDLAVLLGRPPVGELRIGTYDLSAVPPPPLAGVPADLLLNRPDVRAALARLEAADYRVAAARADRLPAIRLTGGVGYNAQEIANVFDDWFVSLAAGLTQPLFDGFRRQAEEARALAVVEERLANYRLVVLTAIKEVEDALVQESKQREHLEALSRELDNARNTHREALERYLKALNDYLPVLAALERAQLLTRSLVSARRELLVFRINLYRALGGTWTRALTAPVRLSEAGALAEVVEQ